MATDHIWNAKHAFGIEGTDRHEDTLRVENNYKDMGLELSLELHLPTLCITYADMQFSNTIGGLQREYPSSKGYGQTYFNPPVTISGVADVEKFTWIRGSHKVVIGPEETIVYWYPKKELVVPRLRIEPKETITAAIQINAFPVTLGRPLCIDVSQYADGQSIGGLRIAKPHPQWVPDESSDLYDLWVRVVDGETNKPIPEAKINVYRWSENSSKNSTHGSIILVDQAYTDGSGIAQFKQRTSGQLETVVLDYPGWRAVTRSFRSFPEQQLCLNMNAWKMQENVIRYTWKPGDTLLGLSAFTATTPESIMEKNEISDASMFIPGLEIDLPCFSATYHIETGDTSQWLVKTFCFQSVEELSMVNGLKDPLRLADCRKIELPGWHFFYSRPGDSVEKIERLFNCPSGWMRYVGRCFHPDPALPMAPEVIAIPTLNFIDFHDNAE